MTKAVVNVVLAKPTIDLVVWGYIPGSALFYCSDCVKRGHIDGNWPHRGDSQSTRCIQHAMDARINDLRIMEGDLIKELSMNPIELDLIRREQCMGKLIRSVTVGGIFTLIAVISTIVIRLSH